MDSQGNVLIAGSVGAMHRDYSVTKFSPAGQPLWSHRLNGAANGDDTIAGSALDETDNVYVTGTSWNGYVSSGGTADDIVTLKFPRTGGETPAGAPNAPGDLQAAAASRSRIDLSWTDNSGNEDGFRIERCAGAGCTAFSQIAQVGSGVSTFSDTGLRRKTTYTYRVRAFNAAGGSDYTNTASATTRR